MKKKTIFLICSVRDADAELQKELQDYVDSLEAEGHRVHYPRRDTDQSGRGIDICRTNAMKIVMSDEVHIWYTPESQGTHFDMGVSFILNKPIYVVKNAPLLPDGKKCYQRMLLEWQEETPNIDISYIVKINPNTYVSHGENVKSIGEIMEQEVKNSPPRRSAQLYVSEQ